MGEQAIMHALDNMGKIVPNTRNSDCLVNDLINFQFCVQIKNKVLSLGLKIPKDPSIHLSIHPSIFH